MIRVCGAHGCSGAQGTLHAQGTGDGAGGDEVVRRVGPTVNAARGARAVGNLGTLAANSRPVPTGRALAAPWGINSPLERLAYYRRLFASK